MTTQTVPLKYGTDEPAPPLWEPGKQFLIITSHTAFRSRPLLSEPKETHVSDLRIILITVEESRIVRGNYNKDKAYWGYRAKGDDGNYYECQWDHFEEESQQPHQNWSREVVEGREWEKCAEYTDKFGNKRDSRWIGEDSDYYICWELAHFMPYLHESVQEEVRQYINEKYPALEFSRCTKKFAPHPNRIGEKESHDTWQYKDEPCFYCEHDL